MKYYASNAYIVDAGGTRRPLILDETKIVDVEPEEVQPGFILSPLMCGALFLSIMCGDGMGDNGKLNESGGDGILCFMDFKDWLDVSLHSCFFLFSSPNCRF